jgi:allantoate deiminase
VWLEKVEELGMAEKSTPSSRSAPRLINSVRHGEAIVERIENLAALSDEPGKLTRLYLGAAHGLAVKQVDAWMRAAGMTVRLDAVGTVVGRYEAEAPNRPTLLLGSHIDTVRNAGRYDGTLGVLAAIAVVEKLHRDGKRLSFAIEVVAFGDEEGVRYPGTLTGSRALAGRFDANVLDEVDRDGISRRDALTAFGCDVSQIAGEARNPDHILGYLEVHIEQGPVLENENVPVAVVTAISGATRGTVTVSGGGGHAGTVPMDLRRDALTAAAEMILAVERQAANSSDLVATVGMCDVSDGAVNAVPGQTAFTIDVRSPSDEVRKSALVDLQSTFQEIARRRSVETTVALTYDAPAAACDTGLMTALSASIKRAGYPLRHLPSGAGHDGMAFRDKIPFAMLFVRCRAGVSHHPAEFAALDDIDIAANVLADCVEHFEPTHGLD